MKFLPAIVKVAVLDWLVELDAAVIVTLPEPTREAPFVIVTNDEPLVADHVQLAAVVTVTVLVPPDAVNV